MKVIIMMCVNLCYEQSQRSLFKT